MVPLCAHLSPVRISLWLEVFVIFSCTGMDCSPFLNIGGKYVFYGVTLILVVNTPFICCVHGSQEPG